MKQYTQQVFVCIAFLLIKSSEWGWVMLFGTKLHFRIAYFFTAFFPSILILLLKIGDLKKMFNWIMLIIFLSAISVICIKKELKSRQSNSKYSSTNIVINFDVQKKGWTMDMWFRFRIIQRLTLVSFLLLHQFFFHQLLLITITYMLF